MTRVFTVWSKRITSPMNAEFSKEYWLSQYLQVFIQAKLVCVISCMYHNCDSGMIWHAVRNVCAFNKLLASSFFIMHIVRSSHQSEWCWIVAKSQLWYMHYVADWTKRYSHFAYDKLRTKTEDCAYVLHNFLQLTMPHCYYILLLLKDDEVME